MITITLLEADLERIRFGYSPLTELATSFYMREHGKVQPSLYPWVDETARALQDVELPYLGALTMRGYIADFLTPPAGDKPVSVEAEIAALRNVPPDVIRAHIRRAIEVGGDNEIRRQFLIYPHELLECLIEELHLYWSRALAGHWSRIRVVLENDVLYRSRIQALKGSEQMLGDLSPNVAYANRELRFHKFNSDSVYSFEGRGAIFSPSVFRGETSGLSWQIMPDSESWMIYRARGSGNWYSDKLPDPEDQLRMALGDAPARLLIALTEPDHTTNLARRLFLTSGAISQQLKRLNRAGLVDSQRDGYRVVYRLSERGIRLIELFGS